MNINYERYPVTTRIVGRQKDREYSGNNRKGIREYSARLHYGEYEYNYHVDWSTVGTRWWSQTWVQSLDKLSTVTCTELTVIEIKNNGILDKNNC